MKIKNLSFSYGDREVLKNVSFSAEYGQFLSVLGPNGVGKSTLFRCLLGLLTPTGGSVSIEEEPILSMSAAQLAKRIAYIPQSHHPVFNFSVFDMVLMGTTAQTPTFATPRKKQFRQVEEALNKLGISHLRDRSYSNISGGERQLVLIARAIAHHPKVLFADEPTAELDSAMGLQVMRLFRELVAKEGVTMVMTTHDPNMMELADHVYHIDDGAIIEETFHPDAAEMFKEVQP